MIGLELQTSGVESNLSVTLTTTKNDIIYLPSSLKELNIKAFG